jgi:hypothetical protein
MTISPRSSLASSGPPTGRMARPLFFKGTGHGASCAYRASREEGGRTYRSRGGAHRTFTYRLLRPDLAAKAIGEKGGLARAAKAAPRNTDESELLG